MSQDDIAIVGMACVFPKAPDLDTFWNNIRDGVDGISEAPPHRIDSVYFDAESSQVDRFYTHRGGFIDDFATFDPAAHGIMPIAARGAEPDQLLALHVATQALKDAGYEDRSFNRGKTDVILGRGNYIGPGMARLVNRTRVAEQLVQSLRLLLPDLNEAQLEEVKRDFQARCGVYGPDTAIGLVPNLVASRISNRLDLGGASYTVDAACASSLMAIDQACTNLRHSISDMALVGGVHLCHDPAFWSVFTQLGALSHSQQIRPFDRKADGLLIGEGIGMVVLKRLEDARKDDDRIYAVIKGSGIASDGRDVSLMTPRVEGQVQALHRAWQQSGLDPDSIGLIEAHGTATNAGDSAEIATIGRFFGPPDNGRKVPLGSVKSMIGHTMPAAGAAGLIKAALAVYHGVIPPSLHCDEPNPALESTRFRVPAKAEPWEQETRRAAVNAFGFGGINAHVILDAPASAKRPARRGSPGVNAASDALILSAPSKEELLTALATGHSQQEGSWRIAVFDPTPQRLATAKTAIEAGRRRFGRDEIYFSPGGLVDAGGKVAFLFPGVESVFDPKVAADIAEAFDLPPLPGIEVENLEHQGIGVILLSALLSQVAAQTGLKPDAIAGHSIGEWSGMIAAGMVPDTAVGEFIAALQPGSLQVANVTYVAVGAGAEKVAGLIEGLDNVHVSHDNCAHQSIICGPAESIEAVQQRLRDARILFEVLPFKSGFHSPALADQVEFYMQNLTRLTLAPPALPLWSATTCAPYPHEPEQITELFRDHLLQPVRFRELIQALYDDGVRVFVQIGTGSLPAFVDDTLAGKPHQAVSLAVPQRSGLAQVKRACAALYVEGMPVDLERLGLGTKPEAPQTKRGIPLELGVPLITLDLPPLKTGSLPPTPLPETNPVGRFLAANLRDIMTAQDAIARAMTQLPVAPPTPRQPVAPPPATPPAPAPRKLRERSERMVMSVANFPELINHCLIPQPADWPILADRGPAVPMTMSLALMRAAAQKLDPDRLPIGIEKVLASNWLHAEPVNEVTITATEIDETRIKVKIDSYIEGTVIMAPRYPDPPPPSEEAIADPGPSPLAVEVIYRDRWLFHGPQYQGVIGIPVYGSNGLKATLKTLPARGAIMDAAGQMVGLWLMMASDIDRLALPLRLGKVEFFGPDPKPDDVLECTIWIRKIGRRDLRADLEMTQNGRLYARVEGWEDWRFQTGGGLFEVMRYPDRNMLSAPQAGGFVYLHDPGWITSTFEFLVSRYISTRELEAIGGVKRKQRQEDWLHGRIAAKDAVRKLLFDKGHGPMFPVEIRIDTDESGRPLASGKFDEDIRVSIAHKTGVAVAIAAEGRDVGIDIEKIEPRSEAFGALAFSVEELELLPAGDRDEWLTRFWCAKEAAGKALGTGLSGNPKGIKLTKVEGERILVDGKWIRSQRIDDHVVAWTEL